MSVWSLFRSTSWWRFTSSAVVVLVLATGCTSGDAGGNREGSAVQLGAPLPADLSAPLGDPTDPPLLGDPAQDDLARACGRGNLRSCDGLFQRGAVGTDYQAYGFSCGGRLDPAPAAGEAPNCRLRQVTSPLREVGPLPEGDSPLLDRLARACADDGGFEACDELYRASEAHSQYESYGTTCGYRIEDTRPNACVGLVGIPVGRPPSDLGNDGERNALAQECFEARMQSCDLLFARSNRGSTYRGYAQSCGGRLEEPVARVDPECDLRFNDPVKATRVPQPDRLGDSPSLDALAGACAAGSMASCDELFETSPVSSDYEAYGATCGGRFDSRRYDLRLDLLTDLRFDRTLPVADECEPRVVNVPLDAAET